MLVEVLEAEAEGTSVEVKVSVSVGVSGVGVEDCVAVGVLVASDGLGAS